jgi:hypothetical protein
MAVLLLYYYQLKNWMQIDKSICSSSCTDSGIARVVMIINKRRSDPPRILAHNGDYYLLTIIITSKTKYKIRGEKIIYRRRAATYEDR